MIKCFCCDCDIEADMPIIPTDLGAVYDGVLFRATGNYGSTLFDPLPATGKGEEFLQIIICDECIRKNAKRVTRIHNIKKIMIADIELFEPEG